MGIVLILFLQCLELGGEPGHFHGALFALGSGGKQDQLDKNGENDQRDTVVVGELIKKGHEPTKGDLHQVRQIKCENHLISS